ncbi:MAG TPA: hypothetical protein VGM52_04540 [Herbaspirillum sp.]|jgi:hypothetical protein
MQKRSENKISYRQRLACFAAPVAGRTWRALIWQLVLVLLMLFAFAGQDAQAVTAMINQTLEIDRPYEFNINENVTLGGYCYPGDAEPIQPSRWSVEDSAGKEITWAGIGFDRLAGFLAPLPLKDYVKPGEKYGYILACKTSTLVWEDHTVMRHFSIRPLIGSYKAVVDTSNNLLVTGSVGNGASRATVYFVDAGGKETYFREANNLTSGKFEIKAYLPYGAHKIAVYAQYGEGTKIHSQLLGTDLVASRPGVGMDELPRFTNNPEIKLAGYANSPEGILERRFQGKDKQGMEYALPFDFSTRFLLTAQENAPLEQTVTVQNDGLYTYQYWVGSKTGQIAASDWQSTVLDRKAPDMDIIFPPAGSYIKKGDKLKVRVIDRNLADEPGSGVASVEGEFEDKDQNKLGWNRMSATHGEPQVYMLEIPFDQLPPGSVSVSAWSADLAGNPRYAPRAYLKAAPPAVTMETPVTPTVADKFTIKGRAHSDAGLEKTWITWWKAGEKNNKHVVALNHAPGTDAAIDREIDLPADGEYLFEISAQSLDSQVGKSGEYQVLLDTAKPVVTLGLPAQDSILEKDFILEFHVEDVGTGVTDVQIQLGYDNPKWIENIPHDGAGNYRQALSLDTIEAGAFTVKIWARDGVNNQEWFPIHYIKKIQAADALQLTLQPLAAGQADATIAHRAPFIYRITLTAQKQTVKNASLRYRLPGGLSRTDAPVVINDHPQALLNAQWDGDADDELLSANSNLKPGESLTLDVPVIVKDVVGDGVAIKSTVAAGAGNLSDGLQATHTVKVRERLEGEGDERVMVMKSSDANAEVQPGARITYRIRVRNQTSRTVRNLLIRDRAADHTEVVASSCGELPAETCSTFTLNDGDLVDGQATHEALCTKPDKKSVPGGRHVFWCLNGDLNPLDDYVVDYTLKVNGAAPPP